MTAFETGLGGAGKLDGDGGCSLVLDFGMLPTKNSTITIGNRYGITHQGSSYALDGLHCDTATSFNVSSCLFIFFGLATTFDTIWNALLGTLCLQVNKDDTFSFRF